VTILRDGCFVTAKPMGSSTTTADRLMAAQIESLYPSGAALGHRAGAPEGDRAEADRSVGADRLRGPSARSSRRRPARPGPQRAACAPISAPTAANAGRIEVDGVKVKCGDPRRACRPARLLTEDRKRLGCCRADDP